MLGCLTGFLSGFSPVLGDDGALSLLGTSGDGFDSGLERSGMSLPESLLGAVSGFDGILGLFGLSNGVTLKDGLSSFGFSNGVTL